MLYLYSMELPRLMTLAQAAEALGVERTTIYRLIAAGELSVVDISVKGKRSGKGLPRLLESEVSAFIKRRTTNARRLYDR